MNWRQISVAGIGFSVSLCRGHRLCSVILYVLCVFTSLFCMERTAMCQFAEWDGESFTTNWNDPINWDTDLVPDASTNVNIMMDLDGGSVDVVVEDQMSASANALTFNPFGSGGQLTVNGSLSVGSLDAGDGAHVLIDTTNSATVSVAGDATIGAFSPASLQIANSQGAGTLAALSIGGTLTVGSDDSSLIESALTVSDMGNRANISANRVVVGKDAMGSIDLGSGATLNIGASSGVGLQIGMNTMLGSQSSGRVNVGSGTLNVLGSNVELGFIGAEADLTVGSFSEAGGSLTTKELIFQDGDSLVSVIGSGVINADRVGGGVPFSAGITLLSVGSGGTANLVYLDASYIDVDLQAGGSIVINDPLGGASFGGAFNSINGALTAPFVTVGETFTGEMGFMDVGQGGVIEALAMTVNPGGELTVSNGQVSLSDNLQVFERGIVFVGSTLGGDVPSVDISNSLTVGIPDVEGGDASLNISHGTVTTTNTFVLENGGILVDGTSSLLSTQNASIQGGFLGATMGGTIEITGDIQVNGGGKILVDNTSTLTTANISINSGVVEVSGTVDGNLIVNQDGILAPGESPGLLQVGTSSTPENLELSGGTLMLEIGGLTQATGIGDQSAFYDHMDIFGDFAISGGTLDVDFFGSSYTPMAGDTFDFWDVGGTTTGFFSSVDLPSLNSGLTWDTSQLYSSGALSISAVPEPSSLSLLVAFSLGLARARRRHRAAT